MSRVETINCDICKKPTERVVMKLYVSAVDRVARHRSPHSDYTHSLDVGECCEGRLMKGFNWRKRMTAEEYADVRRVRKKNK